jgi:hypothetical protein
VLANSNTIKIRANRKPPRPSFQDRVNEPGYMIKAKIIGATNTIIVNPLECVCKEARNIVIVSLGLAFNSFSASAIARI